MQLGCLLLGTAGSLALVHGTSLREHPLRPGRISAPWAALILLVAAGAVWILAQPMDMRGVGLRRMTVRAGVIVMLPALLVCVQPRERRGA